MNAINNIVDVTNYVMAELAQPMHAFDADKLQGDTIFVRSARAGERVVALNEETYGLTPSNLVIADREGPVAIAGVIGGLESAIGPDTKRLVLESANFQAASVRKTSVALKLRTDASMRFEKSQDPVNTVRGLARAVELLEQVSPGIRLVGGVADRKAELKTPPPIELTVDWLMRKLGRPLTAGEVRSILESLEFGVTETAPGRFSVTVPSWRATKDIAIKDDLLEEVGRMVGYQSITPQAPLIAAVVPPENPARLYLRRIRNMAAAQGFTEVSNYSFVSEEMVRAFGFDPEAHVKVTNPIASDQTLLRASLLPGIRKNVLDNSRRLNSFRLFEIGREIHRAGPGLPDEIPHFAAAIYSREGDGSAPLFELKRLAECLMPGCEVRPAPARPFEHPERAAVVSLARRRNRPAVRDASDARRRRAAPRCWISIWPKCRRVDTERAPLSAAAPFPDQRLRSVGGRGPTPTRRRDRAASGGRRGRRSGGNRIRARNTPAPRCPRIARACRIG